MASMAAEGNSKIIVFPLPVDLMSAFSKLVQTRDERPGGDV